MVRSSSNSYLNKWITPLFYQDLSGAYAKKQHLASLECKITKSINQIFRGNMNHYCCFPPPAMGSIMICLLCISVLVI